MNTQQHRPRRISPVAALTALATWVLLSATVIAAPPAMVTSGASAHTVVVALEDGPPTCCA